MLVAATGKLQVVLALALLLFCGEGIRRSSDLASDENAAQQAVKEGHGGRVAKPPFPQPEEKEDSNTAEESDARESTGRSMDDMRELFWKTVEGGITGQMVMYTLLMASVLSIICVFFMGLRDEGHATLWHRKQKKTDKKTTMQGVLQIRSTSLWCFTKWTYVYVQLAEGYIEWWLEKELAMGGRTPMKSIYLLGMQLHSWNDEECFEFRTQVNKNVLFAFKCGSPAEAKLWVAKMKDNAAVCETEYSGCQQAEADAGAAVMEADYLPHTVEEVGLAMEGQK